ncbi:FtsH protease activity modulator HflK [Defluviitalea saccharophila]|uniref:Protein HflK n=1 Tax=Defluviitalea saccharophila TaxID=879970 RepID=A0ABZ2Y404_9FIRM
MEVKKPEDIIIDLDSKKPDLKKLTSWSKRFFSMMVTIALLVVFIPGSFYKVDSGWSAVVLRFGEVQKVEESEGIHFKLPIIDEVKKVHMEQRYKLEYGYRTVNDGSSKTEAGYQDVSEEATVIVEAKENNSSLVLINLIVSYKVADPVNYLFKVDDLEGTIRLALEDVIRNTLQSHTLDEALTNKVLIDSEIMPELQKKMKNFEAGIEIVEVQTQNTELLPAVEEAYQQVEKANQYKNGKLEEAQKYRNTVIPKANAEAAQLIEDAKGYKAEVISNAKANVAQFESLYKEYHQNPNIVKERYYIEAMEEFIKNNKLIIDATDKGDIYKFYNMDDEKNPVKAQTVEQGGN